MTQEAVSTLQAAGVTRREYAEHYFGGGASWAGDVCGCPDDRCAGHHHEVSAACPCLPASIAEVLAGRTGGAR